MLAEAHPAVCWVIRAVAPTIGSLLEVNDELVWPSYGNVFGPRPHYRIRLRGIDPTVFLSVQGAGGWRSPWFVSARAPRGLVEEVHLVRRDRW